MLPLPEWQPSCLLPDDQCLEDSGLWGNQGPALHAGESPAAPGPLEAQPHVSDPHLILRGLAVTSTFSCLQGVGGPRLVCAFENHTQVTTCREPSAASPPQVAQGETAGPPLFLFLQLWLQQFLVLTKSHPQACPVLFPGPQGAP